MTILLTALARHLSPHRALLTGVASCALAGLLVACNTRPPLPQLPPAYTPVRSATPPPQPAPQAAPQALAPAAPKPATVTAAPAAASPVTATPVTVTPALAPAATAPTSRSTTTVANSLDAAVQTAALALLAQAQLPAGAALEVVIDPLVDSATGAQTVATQQVATRLAPVLAAHKPVLRLQAFSPEAVQRQPLLLLGTLTAMNPVRSAGADGSAPTTRSTTPANAQTVVRVCLALVNLKTGLLLAKTLAFADAATVDSSLTALDRDAPAWVSDAATQAYVRSCQGARVGDALHPDYAGRLGVAALLAQAGDDYAAGRYAAAQAKYQAALALPGGEQLRTHMGLYLSHTRLGNQGAAALALGQVVDTGLDQQRLGLRLMFRPGTPAWDNRAVEQRGNVGGGNGSDSSGGRAATATTPATATATATASPTDTLKQRVEQHRQQKAAALVALAQRSAPGGTAGGTSGGTAGGTASGAAKPSSPVTVTSTRLLGVDEPPPWLAVVAQRAAQRQSCIELAGHTGTGAPEPINERLSLLRAEAVMRELARLAPALEPRMLASGQGSRLAPVGSGRNDSSDALDRRVELMVLGC